tara:strand:- start:289 stop:678 length:390 start_codon:yes stop_codon:yes gene_type:complete
MKWIIFRNVKIDKGTLDVVWDIQEALKKELLYKVPYSSEKIDVMNGILQECKKTLDMGYDLWGEDIEGRFVRVKFSEIESQLEPYHAKYLEYMVNTTNRKTRFEMEQWLKKEKPEIYDYMMNPPPDILN